MISSYKNLISSPYNSKNKIGSLRRYILWKLIRLLKINNFKYSLWGDRKIYLNHDSFQSMWIMYNYWVDWEEFNLIKNLVKKQDQVFDIGANMGFYSIWFSKFISLGGNIHSFEPDKNNFNRLVKNISINNNSGIFKLNNNAVSDINGELYFSIGLDGENHILKERLVSGTKIDSMTLDKYCNDHQIEKLSYVKIDVEGFEYAVLKGAETLLSKKKIAVLQLEINQTIHNSGKNIKDILDLIQKYNYKLCCYDVSKYRLTEICYDETRENYFAVANIDYSNLELSKQIDA